MQPDIDAPVFRGWRAVRTGDGSYTFAHPVHGETCHSIAGAWQESWERYALGARLPEVARGTRVSVLDVGTGLGLNLAAALAALDGCTLHAVSLERDEHVLCAAIELGTWLRASGNDAGAPEPLRRWHPVVLDALERALATRDTVALGEGELTLSIGDACATLARVPRERAFDAVFFDPFSRAKEPALWELEVIEQVARRMAPGARLVTYSASLEVRARLAAAGLAVGPLARVGSKAQGTVALRGRAGDAASDAGFVPLFDARTLRRIDARAARLASRAGLPGNSASGLGLGAGS